MKQNLRTLNEIVIHEVEEPISSEKSSKFEDEKSLKYEDEKSSKFENEKYSKTGDDDIASVDMTVVGHKFNDALDGPCFCVKSPKPKIPKSNSASNIGQISKSFSTPILNKIPAKPFRSDQCTSTSDLFDRKIDFFDRKIDFFDRKSDFEDDDDNDDDDDEADTYSCSSVSSRSSRDPRCPRCFIIANTDCSKAVYV
jgi:hypothetical protein